MKYHLSSAEAKPVKEGCPVVEHIDPIVVTDEYTRDFLIRTGKNIVSASYTKLEKK